eukprot:CAMPEP_0194230168 /NCGR_PEP_ID=MMETSP0156-20130528/44267_1 /TAXON_ID=33649 /ORGANISM="Thalassionema nitzschioides, Strain L26-B" /LENGTH=222 /DNA_ID=CAMNT_0038962743 /DNA_START=291 /DNA_END=959 /DNA_ORIENTATION=-
MEEIMADVSLAREYTLCSGTTFKPGKPISGGFEDNSFPLILRHGATVKCGDKGDSSESCVIEGTSNFGALITGSAFGDREVRNVVLQGLTFSGFNLIEDFQHMLIFGAHEGGLTLIDCTFKSSHMKPLFLLDQFIDNFEGRDLMKPAEEGADNSSSLASTALERLVMVSNEYTRFLAPSKEGESQTKSFTKSQVVQTSKVDEGTDLNIIFRRCTFEVRWMTM